MSSMGSRPRRGARTLVCTATAIAATILTATSVSRPARARPATPSGHAASASATTTTQPLAPAILPAAGSAPAVLVFPPYDTSQPRPMAVMLHGMCDEPEYECPYFADSIRQHRWLICPRASLACSGGGAMWSWKRKQQTVQAAVERVKAAYPGRIDEEAGRVLIGFSLGAIAGMDLAHAGAGQWASVILIGAKVTPNEQLLRRSGVERLLMVAGEYDMMRAHMVQQARRLGRKGFKSEFMSLGKVGHAFPSDMNARMAQALAWATGDDAALGAPTSG